MPDEHESRDSKSDVEKLKEAREWYKYVREHEFEKNWRESSLKNLKYFTGEDQGWDEKGDRAALETELRAALTLNRIHPIIRLICGARPTIECSYLPTAGEESLSIASILNSCKDHVEDINKWTYMENDLFKKGVVLDRAVVEFMPEYSYPWDLRGDISLEDLDPYCVYLDPDSVRKDRTDEMKRIIVKNVYPDWAKSKWPEKKKQIEDMVYNIENQTPTQSRDTDPVDRYKDPPNEFYDKSSKKMSLIYYWYKTFEKATKIVDKTTGAVFDSTKKKDEAEKVLEENGITERFEVLERTYTRVHYQIFAHDILFEEGITPWERPDGQRTVLSDNFPQTIFEPDRIVFGSKQELIELIKMFHDPQKFHNKLASSIINIINSTSKSGVWFEEGAMSPEEEAKFRQHGSEPGYIAKFNPGGMAKTQKQKPDVVPTAEMAASKDMAMELLDISGAKGLVAPETLGKNVSGKALGFHMGQGANTISYLFQSFAFFRNQVADYDRDAIQCQYDYEKIIRIRGPKAKYVTINQKQFDETGAIQRILNDISIGHFDTQIREKESSPTLRIERLKYFTEMVKSGALILPPEVINEVTLELMDDPDLKDKIENMIGELRMAAQQQAAAAGGGMPSPGGGGSPRPAPPGPMPMQMGM